MTFQSKRDRSFRARTLVPVVMHSIGWGSQYTIIPGPEQYPAGTMVWVTRNLWPRRFGPWGSEYTASMQIGGGYRSRIKLSEVVREDDGAQHFKMLMKERIIIGVSFVVLAILMFLLFYSA